MLKYPCKKNNECHAVDNLNFNLLPREPFELECIGCNQTVEIDPKIVLKEKKNKTVQTSKSKKTEKKTTYDDQLKKNRFTSISKKVLPTFSVVIGTGIIFVCLSVLIKVIFKNGLDHSKVLMLNDQTINDKYLKKNLLLDIAVEEVIVLKEEVNEELETTIKEKSNKIYLPTKENSKSFSEYIQRYSKLPKEIRQVYESFNIEQLKSSRDTILLFLKNNPAQTYIANIILSEIYTYLSAVDEKPELNRFAIDNLKELQQSYPQTSEWKRSMALALFYVNDFKKSFEYIDSIAKNFQNDPVTQALYGFLMYKLKDKKRGENLLHRIYTIFPQHYLVGDFYIQLLLAEKNFSQAATVFKTMDFSKNEHIKQFKKAIFTFDQTHDWEMIVALHEKFIEEKLDSNSQFIYAKALSRNARPLQALEIFNEIEKTYIANQVNEKIFLLNFEKAYAFYILKNYSESIKYFLKASDERPNHALSLRFIGNCNFRLKQYFEAIEFYEKAYAIDPSKMLLKNIALSYYESKQFNKSIVQFKNLLKDDSENYIYMFYLAQAYFKLGVKEEALNYAQKAQLLSSEKNVQIERLIVRIKQL